MNLFEKWTKGSMLWSDAYKFHSGHAINDAAGYRVYRDAISIQDICEKMGRPVLRFLLLFLLLFAIRLTAAARFAWVHVGSVEGKMC